MREERKWGKEEREREESVRLVVQLNKQHNVYGIGVAIIWPMKWDNTK